jgi:hypothetical protein
MPFGYGNGNITEVGEAIAYLGTNQKDTFLYKEVTLGGALALRGLHLNGISIDAFPNDNAVRVIERAQASFDSITTKGKNSSTGSATGGATLYDMAYVAQSCIGKVTPTIPLHNGVYTLAMFGATGGSTAIQFTLETGATVTTALIPFGDTPASIETKINNALGRGSCFVVQTDTGLFELQLQGEFALAIVISATLVTNTLSGGANTAALLSVTGVGTGWYRYIWDLRGSTNYQSYYAVQGPPDDPEKAKAVRRFTFSSLGLTLGESEATLTANWYGNGTDRRQTVVSSDFDDIVQEVLHPLYWNVLVGKTQRGSFGPSRSCSAFGMSFNIEGYRAPVKNMGCGTKSWRSAASRKPTTSLSFSIAESEESNEYEDAADEGGSAYVVGYYEGPGDELGFGPKAVIASPMLLEKYAPADVDGNAAVNFEGRMGQTNGAVPRLILWMKTASL